MVEAGEDIRWVPRGLVSSVALPGNDFYLFDDQLAVFLLYAGNGLATGMGNPDAVNQDKESPAATAPEVRAPALRWRRAFPGDNAQIGALRRWLESLLPPCPARDDLVSVAVELSTNAVRFFLLSSCVAITG